MMPAPWVLLLILIASFCGVVLVFPFEGVVALSIHFVRITVTVGGAIIFMPLLPARLKKNIRTWARGDYLIVAANFFFVSLVCFSFYNEAGRIFDVDTSVFTSFVAGGFSVLAIIASVLAIIAPDTGSNRPKIIAVAIGAVVSVGLVLVAPLFR